MSKSIYKTLFFILSIYSLIPVSANKNNNFNEVFHICGAYCGPGWCNNMWLSEDKCNTTALPEYHSLTGYSCADLCCQLHDRCCGKSQIFQTMCNTNFIKCLSECNPLSLTCTRYNIPFPTGIIELGMDIVKAWCCGEPCKKSDSIFIMDNIVMYNL